MIRRFCRWFVAPDPPGTFPRFGLLMLVLTVCGWAFVLAGARIQWDDGRYRVAGRSTDSGRVVAKWKATREGAESSTITEYWVRYRYLDHVGLGHERQTLWEHQAWTSARPGDRLPAIEYLAPRPATHRYVMAPGAAQRSFWLGLGLLAAVPCVRLVSACLHGFKLLPAEIATPSDPGSPIS